MSVSFTLDTNSIPSDGYSLCYYGFYNYQIVMTENFAQHESVTKCVRLTEPINFYENYNKEKVHRWPGMTNDMSSDYFVKLTGYFKAEKTGQYTFRLNITNHASLTIDDEEWISLGEIGKSFVHQNVTRTLEKGIHLLTIYYSYADLESALHVEWRRDMGEWQTLSASSLYFGGMNKECNDE